MPLHFRLLVLMVQASTGATAAATTTSHSTGIPSASSLIPSAPLAKRRIASAGLLLLTISIAATAALIATPAATTALVLSAATAAFHVGTTARFHLGLLFHHVDDLVRDAQIFDGVAANVALGHAPETITILWMWGQQMRRDWVNTLRRQLATTARTLDVQITSRKWTFIQVSQLTRCPL